MNKLIILVFLLFPYGSLIAEKSVKNCKEVFDIPQSDITLKEFKMLKKGMPRTQVIETVKSPGCITGSGVSYDLAHFLKLVVHSRYQS